MDHDRIYQLAKNVIEIEAEMIKHLINRIDQGFTQACEHLHAAKGRIIVMGMGKSGHIGKKIAATFASTGSPAFFIHPSEAKHGDMGMLTAQDIVLALSNSGESEEILAILPFIKRLGIPFITLTGKPESKMAKAATVNIDVSVTKEACPLNLAPTASTTAALVMGDALAMALLDMRGFTESDFALTHPGGTLGKRLLISVKEIMHKGDDVPIVNRQANLQTTLLEITQKKLGLTTVVDENQHLVGIFTDGDLRRALDTAVELKTTPIYKIMSPKPKMITETMLAAEALHLMQTHKITSLVVVNDETMPIGIIHIHDILKAGII